MSVHFTITQLERQESGQDATAPADIGTDHGGQPLPAAAIQDVVESSG